ncbi:MAG: hypothetical protein A2W25_12900 [candidate division Zixibacteria bacterium RBG_16_53_22]|nr:MAG: hypothetical protein A2W25_12900 [candidate division Zixibacteria bacterium RBG_16_53_22]
MKPASLKLEKLLQEKLNLLQKMDSFLIGEIARLSEEAAENVANRIEPNDEAVSTIKNIDYEIARIEASEGRDASQISVEARSLIEEVNEVTQRSESRLVELVEKQGEMRSKAGIGPKKGTENRPAASQKTGRDGKASSIVKCR